MNAIKIVVRQLLKNPGFTGVAVFSLAIGLALAASTLAIVNAYLLRSLPYPTTKHVYHLRYAPVGPWEPRGMASIDWKPLDDVVADTITSSGTTLYLKDDGPLTRARSLQVSTGILRGLGVQPVMHDHYVENIRPVLVGLLIAMGIVLVLVCVNVAVLMLLRALRRRKGVAVRVALGARPGHILRMLVAEAGLICFAALAAGLALTAATLRVMTPLVEAQPGKPALHECPSAPPVLHGAQRTSAAEPKLVSGPDDRLPIVLSGKYSPIRSSGSQGR